MNEIRGFDGQYRWLSNFWPVIIRMSGLVYQSVEAAYQAAKTLDMTVRQRLTSATAAESKKIGKTVKLRPDWENIKLDVMYALVKYKFTHNEELRKKLLDTGDAYIEETNYWGDRFWGVSNGTGENHLGKILMRVRKELSKQ